MLRDRRSTPESPKQERTAGKASTIGPAKRHASFPPPPMARSHSKRWSLHQSITLDPKSSSPQRRYPAMSVPSPATATLHRCNKQRHKNHPNERISGKTRTIRTQSGKPRSIISEICEQLQAKPEREPSTTSIVAAHENKIGQIGGIGILCILAMCASVRK
jgi:hypothetical protein